MYRVHTNKGELMPFCTNCGNEVSDKAVVCVKCGAWCGAQPPPRPVNQISDDAGLRLLIPIGRSVWAIVAGYLALFSVLCFPAPFALLTGILALRDIKKHPEKHGRGRAWFGIVMGTLFSMIGLLVLVVLIFKK